MACFRRQSSGAVLWITALTSTARNRKTLRKPIDRIGYGGYLKLALRFPDFIQYIEEICNEFRLLYVNVGDAYTAPSGGEYWLNPVVSGAVKEFVAEGGAFWWERAT